MAIGARRPRRIAIRPPIALMLLVLLAACSKPAGAAYQGYADQKLDARLVSPAAKDGAPGAAGAEPTQRGPMLAYSYAYGLEVARDQITPLMTRHRGACAAAGDGLCQVVGFSVTTNPRGDLAAQLQIRAAPAWLAGFNGGLANDAGKAGGRVVRTQVTSEDLSRSIIDTSARLKAKTALRDRLQAILDRRPGSVADLVATEKALADAQGDLDSATSELAAMRERVVTSEEAIDYAEPGAAGVEGTWGPLTSAFREGAAVLAGSVGFMVRTVIALAPWALVIGLCLWAARRVGWRAPRLGRGKPAAAPE